MQDLKLTDLIDVSILQKMQNGFSEYTKMAALTTDELGMPVTEGSGFTNLCMNLIRKTEEGYKGCKECDRRGALRTLEKGEPAVYLCHAGLVDFAAPIMVEGRFIGSVIGGQVRISPMEEEAARETAKELGIDEKIFWEECIKVNILEKEEIERAAKFLSNMASVFSELAYKNYIALRKSKKLEHAARSQTSFIVNMNANLQKNMRAWLSDAQKALNDKETEEMEKMLEAFINRGTELVSDFEETVEYVKISDGEIELSETEYDIRELLDFLCHTMKQTMTNDEIDFQINIAQNVPDSLLGDEGRIGQIITKLLSDITNSMEKGIIEINVSCCKRSYSVELTIEIKDHGMGMNEAELSDVKEYIENGSLRLLESSDGNKIGFSIIVMLVRQMSGSIRVESVENEGTTFTINLPQLCIK